MSSDLTADLIGSPSADYVAGMPGVDDRYPLGGTERRLQHRVQRVLGADERVLAAVVVFTGPRAGIEGFLAPFFGLASMLINRTRSFTTVAVTDRGLVLLNTNRLRHPTTIRARFDSLDMLGPMNETDGDAWIEVAGKRYWIEGIWSSQLYVIRRLMRGTNT